MTIRPILLFFNNDTKKEDQPEANHTKIKRGLKKVMRSNKKWPKKAVVKAAAGLKIKPPNQIKK